MGDRDEEENLDEDEEGIDKKERKRRIKARKEKEKRLKEQDKQDAKDAKEKAKQDKIEKKYRKKQDKRISKRKKTRMKGGKNIKDLEDDEERGPECVQEQMYRIEDETKDHFSPCVQGTFEGDSRENPLCSHLVKHHKRSVKFNIGFDFTTKLRKEPIDPLVGHSIHDPGKIGEMAMTLTRFFVSLVQNMAKNPSKKKESDHPVYGASQPGQRQEVLFVRN